MTSNRSDHTFSARQVLPYALFLTFAYAFTDSFTEFTLVATISLFGLYRDHRRRSTLRQREDGVYVWIEWHGGERCSDTDPSEPGGDWDSEGDGDGGD